MAIRIKKGDSANLTLEKFSVGLGWHVNEDATKIHDFDLDVSAFMVNASGKIPTDDYLVFYNSEKRLKAEKEGKLTAPVEIVPYTLWKSNQEMREQSRPTDPNMAVIGSIDNEEGNDEGDAETLDIDLRKVPADINRIIICVSIYDAVARGGQNFSQVSNAYIRIYDPKTGKDEVIYDLTEDFATSVSVEFVELRRTGSSWVVKALGVGHKGEFDELVNKYA